MLIQENKHIKEANVVFYGSLVFLSVATAIFAFICGV